MPTTTLPAHGRRAADPTPRSRHRELDPITEPANTSPLNLVKTGPGSRRKKTHTVAVTTGSLAIITAAGGLAYASTGNRSEVAAQATVREAVDTSIVIPPVPLAQPRVDVKAEPAPPPPPPPPVTEVTVAEGDTVYGLAQAHGVNPVDMLAANGLADWSVINPGQVLLLSGPAKPAPELVPAPAQEPVYTAPVVVEQAAPAYVPPAANLSRNQMVLNAAMAQLGEYQDCVKMVADALATVGIYWYKWPWEYAQIGDWVPMDQAVPGDILIYADGGAGVGHVAIYAGNGQAVHGGFNGNETRLFSAYVGSGPVAYRVR